MSSANTALRHRYFTEFHPAINWLIKLDPYFLVPGLHQHENVDTSTHAEEICDNCDYWRIRARPILETGHQTNEEQLNHDMGLRLSCCSLVKLPDRNLKA